MRERLLLVMALLATVALMVGPAAAVGHAEPVADSSALDQDVVIAVGSWRGALGTVECGQDPVGIQVVYFCDHRGNSEQPGTGEVAHSACREAFAATGPAGGLELGCSADIGFRVGFPAANSSGPGDSGGNVCTTSGSWPGLMRYRSAVLDQVFEIHVDVVTFAGTATGGVAIIRGEGSSTGVPEFRAVLEGTIEITQTFPCRQPRKRGLFEGTVQVVQAP